MIELFKKATASCDNEFRRNGKKYGCTNIKVICYPSDYKGDFKRIVKQQFEAAGWKFLPSGSCLCPNCEKLGKDPESANRD